MFQRVIVHSQHLDYYQLLQLTAFRHIYDGTPSPVLDTFNSYFHRALFRQPDDISAVIGAIHLSPEQNVLFRTTGSSKQEVRGRYEQVSGQLSSSDR